MEDRVAPTVRPPERLTVTIRHMEEQQAAAGWYPVPGNQVRYWDGRAWTDHFHDAGPARQDAHRNGSNGPTASRLRNAAWAATANLTSNDQDLPEGTLWSAIGKNLGKVTTGRYRLDPIYLYYSKGALRTEWQQVVVASIFDVDVRQSMTQKTRAVYTVFVRLQDGTAFTMDDIRDGPLAQRTITKAGVDARLALEQRSIHIDAQRHDATNTVRQEVRVDSSDGHTIRPQTVAGLVVPQQESTSPAALAGSETEPAALAARNAEDLPGAANASGYIAQLRELGELRDAGILTDAEFAAKKAEILSRI
jgi:hypothetical protein